MTKEHRTDNVGKREWVAPDLVRLGSIRDVAGSGGAGRQSPIQLRS